MTTSILFLDNLFRNSHRNSSEHDFVPDFFHFSRDKKKD